MKLSPIADVLAGLLKRHFNKFCDWDALRFEVDCLTGGQHPTCQLDKLTDMVRRRLPVR